MCRLGSETCVIINNNFDLFFKFMLDFRTLAAEKGASRVADRLFKLSDHDALFIGSDYKSLYKKYKEFIDITNRRMSIYCFVRNVFTEDGELNENYAYYLDYVYAHKDQKEKIFKNVARIYNLGIPRFELNEDAKFEEEDYAVCNIPGMFTRFTFVDNVKIIPEYETSSIKYKTAGSPFTIDLRFEHDKSVTPEYATSMIVNTLLFDTDILPSVFTEDNTYNRIIRAKKASDKTINLLRQSIDLSVGIDDLTSEVSKLSKTVASYDFDYKEKMLDTLTEIKRSIIELDEALKSQTEENLREDRDLSPAVINEEKRRYLRNREASMYDYD